MRQRRFPELVKREKENLKSLGFYLKYLEDKISWQNSLTAKQIKKTKDEMINPIFNWQHYISTKEGLNNITNSMFTLRKLINFVETKFEELKEIPTEDFKEELLEEFKEDINTKLYYLLFYGENSRNFLNSLVHLSKSNESAELSENARTHLLFILNYLKEKKLIKP